MSFGPFEGDTGVGTFGGSEDHTAILNCQSDTLSLYAYRPLRFRRSVTIADRYVFAIASSGITAEKTGGAWRSTIAFPRSRPKSSDYGKLQQISPQTHSPTSSIQPRMPRIGCAVFSTTPRSRHSRPKRLAERLDHLVIENRLVESVPNRLDSDTINEFGALAIQSHQAAAQLLNNQTAETNGLVELATQLGARWCKRVRPASVAASGLLSMRLRAADYSPTGSGSTKTNFRTRRNGRRFSSCDRARP